MNGIEQDYSESAGWGYDEVVISFLTLSGFLLADKQAVYFMCRIVYIIHTDRETDR